MTLIELLEEKARCRNRLWDVDMEERYLALEKELIRLANESTLVLE